MEQTFPQWIIEQLESREWSRAELARRAGLSQSVIYEVLSGNANPGYKLCVSIGKAFELTPESIFRAAGLLPAYLDIDDKIRQILDEVAKLPKDDREEVLAFIRLKRRLLEKGSK
jgi:transcriptional regulator with XRE-family HTH domain